MGQKSPISGYVMKLSTMSKMTSVSIPLLLKDLGVVVKHALWSLS